MVGIEAEPSGKFLGACDRRGGPEGTKTALVGGKEKVLHRAGGTAEFVEPGNLTTRFGMGSNGDYGWRLLAVVAQFGALFRARFGHGGTLVVKGLECVGQTGPRLARENMETPRLSETVGWRPMSVFKDFDKKLVSNFAAGIHESRLDGAPRAIGKISRHGIAVLTSCQAFFPVGKRRRAQEVPEACAWSLDISRPQPTPQGAPLNPSLPNIESANRDVPQLDSITLPHC
jgi:hypothetical protein